MNSGPLDFLRRKNNQAELSQQDLDDVLGEIIPTTNMPGEEMHKNTAQALQSSQVLKPENKDSSIVLLPEVAEVPKASTVKDTVEKFASMKGYSPDTNFTERRMAMYEKELRGVTSEREAITTSLQQAIGERETTKAKLKAKYIALDDRLTREIEEEKTMGHDAIDKCLAREEHLKACIALLKDPPQKKSKSTSKRSSKKSPNKRQASNTKSPTTETKPSSSPTPTPLPNDKPKTPTTSTPSG